MGGWMDIQRIPDTANCRISGKFAAITITISKLSSIGNSFYFIDYKEMLSLHSGKGRDIVIIFYRYRYLLPYLVF
jgi:hypothetical protein